MLHLRRQTFKLALIFWHESSLMMAAATEEMRRFDLQHTVSQLQSFRVPFLRTRTKRHIHDKGQTKRGRVAMQLETVGSGFLCLA